MQKIYLPSISLKRHSIHIGLIVFIFLITSIKGFSQTTYVWNQTGTADWTVAANWTPNRGLPAANDILVFNNAAITTPINIPTETIGQLSVTNNTTVNLQGGVVGAILTISGLTGTDLFVDAGSALNINAVTNTTTITLATGATGSITGNMTFSNAAHRLDAADPSGIIFSSSSIFTQGTGCTGNVFTAAGTNNAIVFATGATFNQLDGGNPFAKAQPASKVVFNTGSLFHFQVPSTAPSFSGRVYANLEFSGSGTVSTTTGANAVSIDNLTISTGTLNFNMTGTPGHSIKGNISVASGATLNFSPASAGTVSLNGTSSQSITNSGTLTFGTNHTLEINNTAGVTLNSPITLSNQLTLTAGNLTIGNNDLITGTISGGSPTSYIVTNGTGKLTRQNISTAVLFPIGTTTTFNPLNIGNGANLDYAASVESGFSNPGGIADPTLAINRTWHVTASATPAGPVSIDYFYTGTPVTDAGAAFAVVPATVNLGLYLSNPPYGWWGWNINTPVNITQNTAPLWPGMYYANSSVVSFLGNVDLPMVIGNGGAVLSISRSIDLTVQKQSSKAILNWAYNNVTGIKEVAVERSINGRSFNKLGTVASLITTYTDDNLLAGTNYYRIKITDVNGKITYSAIAAIINATDGFDIVALLPSIVHSDMQVSIAAAQKTKLDMAITDVMGRPVSKLQFTVSAGSNMFDVNVSKLSAGMYYLTATTASGEIKTMRFVKQ